VIHLEPVLPLAEWLERLAALERRLKSGAPVTAESVTTGRKPSPDVQQVSVPAVSPVELPVDANLEDRWQAFLTHVQETGDAPLYGKLAQCRLVGMSDHGLKIALKHPWNTNGARHEARLRELAKGFFGPETTLEFEVEASKTPKKSTAAPKKSLDMKKLQQQALEIFGGEWLAAKPAKEEPE